MSTVSPANSTLRDGSNGVSLRGMYLFIAAVGLWLLVPRVLRRMKA